MDRQEQTRHLASLTDAELAQLRNYIFGEPTPKPITLDDLKSMTAEEIVDAHQAGRLDHLPAEQGARNQARRDQRAERARAAAQQNEHQRQNRSADANRLSND